MTGCRGGDVTQDLAQGRTSGVGLNPYRSSLIFSADIITSV